MKGKPLGAFLILSVLLLTNAGAIAQSLSPAAPDAPLGSAFAYHGQLNSNGAPVDDNCDFQFDLFDALNAVSPVAATQTATNVSVVNGLFTTQIDFGASAFTGEARWLEIAVACPSGSGLYTTLSPRQPLSAAPYALSLAPNATVNGLNNTGNLSFGSSPRQMLHLWGTQYGIGVQHDDAYFRADNGTGFAWYTGGSHSDTHYDPGPQGSTLMTLDSSDGLSIKNKLSFGMSMRQMVNLWGSLYGMGIQNRTMYLRADKTGGFAWYEGGSHSDTRYAPGSQGATLMTLDSSDGLSIKNKLSFGSSPRQMIDLWDTQYGIGVQSNDAYFRTDNGAGFAWYSGGSHSDMHYDPGCTGVPCVRGWTLMTLDPNGGLTVKGPISATTSSPSAGTAVFAKSDEGVGVLGMSNAAAGVIGNSLGGEHGVIGTANTCKSSDCNPVGVYGRSVDPSQERPRGTGVLGEGDRVGVRGESFLGDGVDGSSVGGYGVYGTSGNFLSSGVYGESTGRGHGVEGRADGDKAAVFGNNNSADGGIGVEGRATGNRGTGVKGIAAGLNSYGVYGTNAPCASGMNCYAIYSDGNFAVAPGWTKSAIVHTATYGDRKLYAMESPGNWFEDFGSGQIQQGTATVAIDPIFAQTVNLTETYHVFLTPLGDCALYVSEKTESLFTVKAVGGGVCNIDFDFRIVAKRLGFENVRLEPASASTSR